MSDTIPFSLAPIAIFAYRRPDHLRNMLQSLLRCEGFAGSPVFVFCDGPRSDAERADVEATRAVARELLGEEAEYHFSATNRGLSASVIAGVSDVLTRFDRVIVIEDDLLLSPGFLSYMNNGLMVYADNARLFQVSGYTFGIPGLASVGMSSFLPFTTSWGWATWRRAWHHFDSLAEGWQRLQDEPDLRRRFNLDGAYDYATMLERQMQGRCDSWAIRWYWSVFSAGGLVLYPPTTLVMNEGMDGSGVHGRGLLRRYWKVAPSGALSEPKFPAKVVADPVVVWQVADALRWQNGGLCARFLDLLRRLFGR
jgi:hypothetical protein